MGDEKIRVGVLFGGRSGEHEVSLASARSVIDALRASGRYDVLEIGVTPEGRWIAGPDAHATLSANARFLLPESAGDARDASRSGEPRRSAALLPGERSAPLVPLDDPGAAERLDVVFPVLHGPQGEDGTVQGFLELAGVPYVGCGVAASAVGMDKVLMKGLFQAAGLPQVDWVAVRAPDWQRDPAAASRAATALGFPVFVKPANMGSSVGITKARDAQGLARGLAEAFRYDTKAVVERGIDAREIECSVLGTDEPRASVPGEILPSEEFYDYRAKYLSGEASRLVIPAPLDEAQTREVRDLAVRAFRAIDGAGMARADFLLERGTGRLVVNELNTIPGFTRISMYAKLWAASGLAYPDLLDELIRLAIERQRQRERLETRYTPPAPSD